MPLLHKLSIFLAIVFLSACARQDWVITLELPTSQMSSADQTSIQSRVRDILIRRLELVGARRATVELKDNTELIVRLKANAEKLRIQSLLTQRGRLEIRVALDDPSTDKIVNELARRGLTLVQFSDQVHKNTADPKLIKLLPRGSLLVPTIDERVVIVDNNAGLLTGVQIEDVSSVREEGGSGILMKFGPEGRQTLEKITQANIGKSLAFILDGTVLVMPVIRAPIPDGSAMIEGKFTIDDLGYLIALLKAGELPVEPKIILVH